MSCLVFVDQPDVDKGEKWVDDKKLTRKKEAEKMKKTGKTGKTEKAKKEKKEKCLHCRTEEWGSSVVCTNCSSIVQTQCFAAEWTRDNHSSVHSHHQRRATQCKGIHKDVACFNIPPHIVNKANEMYLNVVQHETKRGDGRKGIICACLQNAYKEESMPVTMKQLSALFGIKQKYMYKGFLKFSTMYGNLSEQVITAYDLIPKRAELFNLNDDDVMNIRKIHDAVVDKSSVLKRSEPQSLASGLVYFYLVLNGWDITRKACASTVELSEITIQKIAKLVAKILGVNLKV
jgi:hypothetical protein